MFESLTKSLNGVFRNVRGRGKLSEKNVKDALREVRMALLEADVNYKVAKDFMHRVKEECLGTEVLESVTPGQQFVKVVHEEMIALLGGEITQLDSSDKPMAIMMLGLHGAGKTTTCGKLARRLKKEGHNVVLVACDIRRPAAVDQLRILSEQAGVGLVTPRAGESVPELGRRAREHAAGSGFSAAIYDTGGRFQIDDELVGELKELRSAVDPRNVLLVLDAAIGQESVDVATSFHEAVQLTGLVLTKLDGDARGGAALSVQAVTGCPILMVGTGEREEDFEPFHPDRMASRILGMGDVVSLVEKAQEAIDEDEVAQIGERFNKNKLNLEDFLKQIRQMKKLGPLENLLELMPGMSDISEQMRGDMMGQSADGMKQAEAIILSMTPEERCKPDIINGSRRRRIAAGCGLEVRDVNRMLKSFQEAKKMGKNMKKMQKKLLRMGRLR